MVLEVFTERYQENIILVYIKQI